MMEIQIIKPDQPNKFKQCANRYLFVASEHPTTMIKLVSGGKRKSKRESAREDDSEETNGKKKTSNASIFNGL